MFAPRVAKSQDKAAANSTGKQAARRSTPVTSVQPAGYELDAPTRESEETRTLHRTATPGIPSDRAAAPSASVSRGSNAPSWDFGRIPIHPADRVKPIRASSQ